MDKDKNLKPKPSEQKKEPDTKDAQTKMINSQNRLNNAIYKLKE